MKDVNYTSPERTLISYLSAKDLKWEKEAIDQLSQRYASSSYKEDAYLCWLSWHKEFVMGIPLLISLKYEDKEYAILIIKILSEDNTFGVSKNNGDSFVFVKEDSLWKYQSAMDNDIFLIKEYIDKNILSILSQTKTNDPKQ